MKNRLDWLQALRGFCAFVVLFFHIGTVAVPLLVEKPLLGLIRPFRS